MSLGTLVIIVSYTLEAIASRIQRRRNLDTYSRLEWSTNEFLQLQRLAHEELGVGTWHGGAEAIPFTDSGERLATLDIGNLDHPRLQVPPTNFDEVLAQGDEAAGQAGSSPSEDHEAQKSAAAATTTEELHQEERPVNAVSYDSISLKEERTSRIV